MAPFDAFIYPTVALAAPTIEAAGASDSAYVALNLKLLRNPGLVNGLDGSPLVPNPDANPNPNP
jgi:aspartyl-tRNA(Asn)/glutamyl-tRNA(Gln) amidotransferase subunit A